MALMAARISYEGLEEYHVVRLFSTTQTDVQKMYEQMNLVPSYESLYEEATEHLNKMLKVRPVATPFVCRKEIQNDLGTPNVDNDLCKETPQSPQMATTSKENSPSSCSQDVIISNVTEIPVANVQLEVSTSLQTLVAPPEYSSTKSVKESAVKTSHEQPDSNIRSKAAVVTEYKCSKPTEEFTEIIYLDDSEAEDDRSEDTCFKNSTKESLPNYTNPDIGSPTKQPRGRPRTNPIKIATEEAKCKPRAPVSINLKYSNQSNCNNSLLAEYTAAKKEQEEETIRNEKISKRTESTDSGLGPDATIGLDDDRSRPPLEMQEFSNRSQDIDHRKRAARESPSVEKPNEVKYKSTPSPEKESPTKRKRGRPKASPLIPEQQCSNHSQHLTPSVGRSSSAPTKETPLKATSSENEASIRATPENGPPKKRPRGRSKAKPLMIALEEAKCKPCAPVFIDLGHTNLSDCTKTLLKEYMTDKEDQQKAERPSRKKLDTRRNEKTYKTSNFTQAESDSDETSHDSDESSHGDNNSVPKIKINLVELRKRAEKSKIDKRNAKKKAPPMEEYTEETAKKTQTAASQKKSFPEQTSIYQEQGKNAKHAKCESRKEEPVQGNSGKVTKITKKIASKPISVSIPIKSYLLEKNFIKKANIKTPRLHEIEYNNNTILPEYAIPTSEFNLDKLMVTSIVAKRFVDPIPLKVFSPYEEVEKLVCISCNKPFQTKQELASHKLSQHQTYNY